MNLSSRIRVFSTLAPISAMIFLASGCNSASSPGGSGAAATTPTSASAPASSVPVSPGATGTNTATTAPASTTPPANGSAPQVGESCTGGDANKICLAMHFVAYKDPNGTPVMNTTQAATIVHTMNQLWAQCDIGFQIEKYEAVDPTQSNLAYGAEAQNQLDQIRQAFASPTDELLGVTTGPWGTAVNAWTALPGDSTYGAVMEASIVDYGAGIIYAHEFGHYLGLDHVSDQSDLMNPVIYTTSTKLTPDQCSTAQQNAESYWKSMIRK